MYFLDALLVFLYALFKLGDTVVRFCDFIFYYRVLLFEVVEALIEKIREIGCFADPVPSGKEFLDEEDRVFYEVTLSHAEENAKLVTGNARHFPVDPIVISAAQFCEIIGA